MRTIHAAVAAALALGFFACKKDAPAAAPSGTATGAATAPATVTPPVGAPPAPGQSLDAKMGQSRRLEEIKKLIGELPASTKGGESPEAVMRAFVEAASRKDMASAKDLMVSTSDLRTFVPADKQPKALEQVASVLYKMRRPIGPVEILGFLPGQMKEFKAGERGFTTNVTVMLRAKLQVKMNGKERKLRFKSLLKVGDRWKVAEL